MTIILVRIDLHRVVSELSSTKLGYVLLAVFLVLLKYWISALRWRMLLTAKSIDVDLTELARLYLIGAFFNTFLPTNVGGDAVKIAKLGKKTGEGIDSAASVFMERFTGVVVLVFISSAALVYFYKVWGLVLFVGILLAFTLGFFVLHRIQNIHHLMQKFYRSVMAYKSETRILAYALIVAFIAQAVVIGAYYAVFLALHLQPPLLWTIFVLPIIILAGFLPISLNGLGIEESLFILFFGTYLGGTTTAQALAVSFMFRFVKLAASLVGGLLYSLEKIR